MSKTIKTTAPVKDAFEELVNTLQDVIKTAYTEGMTIEEAEKTAGRFLEAQMIVADKLANVDLDSRMRKSGLKTIKASVYMEHATKGEKKPSDVMLEAIVNKEKLVTDEQAAFDNAEVNREYLQNLMSIFKEGHIYFRQLSKGQ